MQMISGRRRFKQFCEFFVVLPILTVTAAGFFKKLILYW